MKNNKGFTLIEVLASIIILGVVSVVAVPRIFDYITSSRESIYVQDARKMIAQAQYRMSASSTEIEKPSDKEVVVFTLNYLAQNDFHNAPNGGKYMFDTSFVIVTYSSTDKQYHYAAMLVEKISEKDYKGVKLSTEELINTNKRGYMIRVFSADELVFPTERSNSYQIGDTTLDTSYIKTQLSKEATWWNALPNTETEKSIVRVYHDKNAIEFSTAR